MGLGLGKKAGIGKKMGWGAEVDRVRHEMARCLVSVRDSIRLRAINI